MCIFRRKEGCCIRKASKVRTVSAMPPLLSPKNLSSRVSIIAGRMWGGGGGGERSESESTPQTPGAFVLSQNSPARLDDDDGTRSQLRLPSDCLCTYVCRLSCARCSVRCRCRCQLSR